MSDETTLLSCPFCGGEAEIERYTIKPYVACVKCGCSMPDRHQTAEQVIEVWNTRAELESESPYDELLRCLENDWHISASWDGLRKFWCIELTEEGVKLRDAEHGTLTAEQVREAIEKRFDFDVWVPSARWQAIADELNAELGSGTCENVDALANHGYFKCSECGIGGYGVPNYCPNCGARVKESSDMDISTTRDAIKEKWAIISAKDCADFSGTVTGRVLKSNLDKLPEPNTLFIYMTRGEHRVRESVSKAFGNIKRVVIDVDGEKHEYDADALIALLEGLEVRDD